MYFPKLERFLFSNVQFCHFKFFYSVILNSMYRHPELGYTVILNPMYRHPELAGKSVEAKPKRDFTPLLGLLTLPPNILLSTCHPELVSGSY